MVISKGRFCNDIYTGAELHFCDPEAGTVMAVVDKNVVVCEWAITVPASGSQKCSSAPVYISLQNLPFDITICDYIYISRILDLNSCPGAWVR
jgi:hypothetical protein